MPSELPLQDLGELNKGFQILESWQVNQLIRGVKLLVNFAMVGHVALLHLILSKFELEFQGVFLSPEDIVADVVHIAGASIHHVSDTAELGE